MQHSDFQEKRRPDSDPLSSDDASAQQLLGRLRRLREPGSLPNLRVCQVVGAKVCLRSCDPFGLDAEGTEELMQLGLRSIIDLRSEHERNEAQDAPLYSYLRVLRWQSDDRGNDTFVEDSPLSHSAIATVYRIDCLRSPQSQLRRFLTDYTGPCRLCVPDVSAFVLPAACGRPAAQLLRDVLDCFPAAMAAAFRVLARPDTYPVLLTSPDGQQTAAVVSCLMQMVVGEDPSITADMHAASEIEFIRSRGGQAAISPEDQAARLKESRRTMLELIDYVTNTYRSAENYLPAAGRLVAAGDSAAEDSLTSILTSMRLRTQLFLSCQHCFVHISP